MGSANIGYQTAGGLCSLSKRLDVARMAGAHLDDSYLVLLCESEQRLGHTYIIIEIALSIEHIVFLRKDCSNEFLGGSLAVSASDANDWDIELTTMLTGQILKGLQTIVDNDKSVISRGGNRCIIYDSIGTAFLEGRQSKLVAVERFAFQGQKDASLRTITTIGCDTRVLQIKLV